MVSLDLSHCIKTRLHKYIFEFVCLMSLWIKCFQWQNLTIFIISGSVCLFVVSHCDLIIQKLFWLPQQNSPLKQQRLPRGLNAQVNHLKQQQPTNQLLRSFPQYIMVPIQPKVFSISMQHIYIGLFLLSLVLGPKWREIFIDLYFKWAEINCGGY